MKAGANQEADIIADIFAILQVQAGHSNGSKTTFVSMKGQQCQRILL